MRIFTDRYNWNKKIKFDETGIAGTTLARAKLLGQAVTPRAAQDNDARTLFDNEFSPDGNECLNSLSQFRGPPQCTMASRYGGCPPDFCARKTASNQTSQPKTHPEL